MLTFIRNCFPKLRTHKLVKQRFGVLLKCLSEHEGARAKVQAIKDVRQMTGLGLKEAKALIDNIPEVVGEDLDYADAYDFKNLLESHGATAEIFEETAG